MSHIRISLFCVLLLVAGCDLLTGPEDSEIERLSSAPIDQLVLEPTELTLHVGEIGAVKVTAFSRGQPVEQFGISFWFTGDEDSVEWFDSPGADIRVRGLRAGEATLNVRVANEFVEEASIFVVPR